MEESPLTLRQHIAAAIENASGAGKAAIDVIRLLENCGFGLYGNGWLDDDPELVQILAYGDSEGSDGGAGMPEGDRLSSAADFSATLATVDAFFFSATGGVDEEQNTESPEDGSPS